MMILSKFVGKVADQELVDDLKSRFHCSKVRIVKENEIMTMDFIQDRITIMVDKNQIIKKIWNS